MRVCWLAAAVCVVAVGLLHRSIGEWCEAITGVGLWEDDAMMMLLVLTTLERVSVFLRLLLRRRVVAGCSHSTPVCG